MHWGAYEVFSVISGVVLVAGVLAPGAAAKERLGAFFGGAFFIAYGIFVASRTSGTWVFPVWIFVIPFVGVGYVIYRLVTLTKGPQPPAVASPLPTRAPIGTSGVCPRCGARATGEAGCRACGGNLLVEAERGTPYRAASSSASPQPEQALFQSVSPRVQAPFCSQCGARADTGAAYCGRCGAVLENA